MAKVSGPNVIPLVNPFSTVSDGSQIAVPFSGFYLLPLTQQGCLKAWRPLPMKVETIMIVVMVKKSVVY